MLLNLLKNSKLGQDLIILLLSVSSLLLGRKYLPVRVKSSKKLMKKGGAQASQAQAAQVSPNNINPQEQSKDNTVLNNGLKVVGAIFLFPLSIVYVLIKFFTNMAENNILKWILIPLFLFISLNAIFISYYHIKLRAIKNSVLEPSDEEREIKELNRMYGYSSSMLFDDKNLFIRVLEYWFTSLYYTFTCLSTVGFGDIYPVGIIPRSIFILFISYSCMSAGNYFFGSPNT